jgi:hypothetical protein
MMVRRHMHNFQGICSSYSISLVFFSSNFFWLEQTGDVFIIISSNYKSPWKGLLIFFWSKTEPKATAHSQNKALLPNFIWFGISAKVLCD